METEGQGTSEQTLENSETFVQMLLGEGWGGETTGLIAGSATQA